MIYCDCGFSDDSVHLADIPARARAAAARIITALSAGAHATEGPAPDRWSALEYAAHVRDVLLTIRDRLVIGLVEDDPTFKPLYRDERIDLGLYRTDTTADVSVELHAATEMFVRLFTAIDAAALGRTVQYGWPDPTTRTLEWMGKQAVHEMEHHLTDIEENLARRT